MNEETSQEKKIIYHRKYGRPVFDLTGEKFGKLTVLNHVKGAVWSCQCSCKDKTIVEIGEGRLKSGGRTSCGCYFNKKSNDPEYDIWSSMIQRCTNKNSKDYYRYGGRGITVCDRWLSSYTDFITDLGKRPDDTYSLDRINNDGNYCPENCRWATLDEQLSNTSRNKFYTFNGKSLTIRQWAKELGFKRGLLEDRLRRGWTLEKALTTQPEIKHRRKTKNGKENN